MRAIIMAMGEAPGIAPMNERYPGPLLPLVDRPFVQHVVEYLADQGVRHCHFVLSHLPRKIEDHLGDGRRWGLTFTFHLLRDHTRPYRILRVIDLGKDDRQPLLLGHADRLPALALTEAGSAIQAASGQPVLFANKDTAPSGERCWTGWAVISPEHLANVPSDANEDAFLAHLVKCAGGTPAWFDVPALLDMSRFDRILEAHQAALDPRLQLVVAEGPDKGRIYPLPQEGSVRVGTAPLAEVRLTDSTVAADCCEIQVKDARVTVVRPPGNGKLLVNGEEVTDDARTSGDVLRVGGTQLRLEPSQRFAGLVVGGREIEAGVWLGRNVVLHSTARVYPPVYIGENCTIGPGVTLGPNAVVGSDCMLDEKCIVSNSIIFPGSYVGEGVEVVDSLVDKNRLVIARLGHEVVIREDFILGSMTKRHMRPLIGRALAWLLALFLLVLTAPLLLGTALWLKLTRPGPVWHRRRVVRLPVPDDGRPWRDYLFWSFLPPPTEEGETAGDVVPRSVRGVLLGFLPALINVVRRDLNLVGLPPRSRKAIQGLSEDWQKLYLQAKAGIVTEASARFASVPTVEEAYIAEAFYVVSSGLKYDLRLLTRYLARSLFGALIPRRSRGEEGAAPVFAGAAIEAVGEPGASAPGGNPLPTSGA
jgi:lipopolysaccharide/colanic/teichoic acid biosynthesis glycosyltransferase